VLLIGSGVADVAGISPMTPFLTMAVLGFVLLIRAIDNAPATPTLQSAGRAKSPARTTTALVGWHQVWYGLMFGVFGAIRLYRSAPL